ncbi:MAG TPA: hypothetical protein VJM51_08065 [Dehalococcoidia bacterium]|nr:hypothetical protein [Dehalococcoidia bacterium]
MAAATLSVPLADVALREWSTNRGRWQVLTEEGEPVLTLPHNPFSDDRYGVAAIAGDTQWRDYVYSLEVAFTGNTGLDEPDRGWLGVILRAQDTENYELFWFMPHAPEGHNSLAYLSVAHGVVPWWTHAYEHGPRGSVPFIRDRWLPVQFEVRGDSAFIAVGSPPKTVLSVKLTYYLEAGCVGVYCGTRTNGKFRRMRVEHL